MALINIGTMKGLDTVESLSAGATIIGKIFLVL